MNRRAEERLYVEQGLRRALQRGELVVHYQPQVSLHDGELSGAEALLRWQHPSDGLIPPLRFIGIAEETGLIEPLGSWVLKAACVEAARWLAGTRADVRLSVNVSAEQIVGGSFHDRVLEALDASGLSASRLELELTEGTLQALKDRSHLIDDLKRLGVTIAIDDFGTGYSSLGALKSLPVDRLKIDRSFVSGLPASGNDVAIVEAVLALSRSLDLGVIAEGVETAGQLEALRRIGCREAQGYLFARPVPIGELERLPGKWPVAA
jgi:EAL domain-containing protein (putative c-di-GMP-specific phosphodiesterase class I)